MNVANPRYGVHDGYAYLSIEIDGDEVRLLTDQQKPSLTAAGLTYLGDRFTDSLPPIRFRGDVFHGFTDDPVIHKLFTRFWRDVDSGNFTEGPVPMPD